MNVHVPGQDVPVSSYCSMSNSPLNRSDLGLCLVRLYYRGSRCICVYRGLLYIQIHGSPMITIQCHTWTPSLVLIITSDIHNISLIDIDGMYGDNNIAHNNKKQYQ